LAETRFVKICFVCDEYPPVPHGGIGSVTQLLGRELAARSHEVRVIGTYARVAGSSLRENDSGVGIWRIPIPHGRFGWVRARRMLYQTIAQWAQRGEIDLVEVPDWAGYAAGWPRLKVPVVTRLHGSVTYFSREMRQPIPWPVYCLEAASFHRSNFWCSASEYTARRTARLFGTARKPIPVLFNPVEIRPDAPDRHRDRFRVVFAGTLTAKKGVISLIRAWPAIARVCPRAELHLFGKDAGAGEGRSMRDHLLSLLPDGFAHSVHFHGHICRDALRLEFRKCRLAIFPSFAEAFAMTPMEAMAESCPVIYSQRSSGPELIEHGVNGLLVDPASSEQISEAILFLLSDEKRCERLGAAGRESVAKRFSTNILMPRNEVFYKDCLARYG
jgi:glycogen(starch) synthase